jgi:hydroxylaminobenzene mutase
MEQTLRNHGRWLLWLGVALLIFVSLEGLAIPHLASPRLGLSVHSLGALQSVLLLAFGLMWPQLELGPSAARTAFWLFVYSTFAILFAYMLGAVWGAGNETIPLAAGSAHGSSSQETLISLIAYSSAPTGLISFGLVLWGLRGRQFVNS